MKDDEFLTEVGVPASSISFFLKKLTKNTNFEIVFDSFTYCFEEETIHSTYSQSLH